MNGSVDIGGNATANQSLRELCLGCRQPTKCLRKWQNRCANRYRTRQRIGTVADDIAGKKSRFIALPTFKRSKEKCFFLDNRTAESSAELGARKRCFDRRERIACLNAFITNKPENIAAKIVSAAFGNDINDAARGASEFGRVRIGRHLIFLHGFLADRGARSVDGIIGKIRTVNLHKR